MRLLRGIPRVRALVIMLESWAFKVVHRHSCRGGIRVYGWPAISVGREAILTLGDGVRMISDDRFNELGYGGRCSIRVGAGAVCEIGDSVRMSGTRIHASSRVVVGEQTLLGAGVTIMDSDLHPLPVGADGAIVKCAPVVVGSRVFVGAGAYILKGVTIGDGAIVGAGAVVTKPVPAGAVAVGNPASVIQMADRAARV